MVHAVSIHVREQPKASLEKVKSDSELQETLKAVTSPEAAIEIVQSAGFLITSGDIQSIQYETTTDEELEGASGGTCFNPSGNIYR